MTTLPRLPQTPARMPRRRFASLRTIMALMLREMATTYGRSPGGYLWAVLEPVAGIALLSVIFSVAFRSPAIGTNFPLFYATGVLPFMSFTTISNKLAQSLNFSRQLLAYPAVTYIDAILARFVLTLLTEMMVAFVVLGGILLIFDTRVIPDFPTILNALALAGALGLGVGTLNCYLTTRFPVWQQIWGVAMRPMFLISCVIFLYDSIPEPYRGWLWFNPVVHAVGLMRRGFYTTYDATYVSQVYVLAFAGLCLVAGLTLLHRNYRLLLQR